MPRNISFSCHFVSFVVHSSAMRHPKRKQWEDKLAGLLQRIDVRLEQTYGDDYPLHPSRPKHGATANPKYSGLFQVSAGFSAGYGTEHGRGYVIEVRMVSLVKIPDEARIRIEADAMQQLRQELPTVFPGRELQVEQDGPVYKIFGDLSLGEA